MLWFNIITAGSTVILAIITFFYLLETRQMRKITQEMLRVSNAPEIQVSLLKKSQPIGNRSLPYLVLSIQNIGTGFAYDMKFTGTFTSFRPESSDKAFGDYGIIKKGISYLGPGKGYQIALPHGTAENVSKDHLSIEVTYKDSANNEKKNPFPLDFTKVESDSQIGDPSLDSIATSLRHIERYLFRQGK